MLLFVKLFFFWVCVKRHPHLLRMGGQINDWTQWMTRSNRYPDIREFGWPDGCVIWRYFFAKRTVWGCFFSWKEKSLKNLHHTELCSQPSIWAKSRREPDNRSNQLFPVFSILVLAVISRWFVSLFRQVCKKNTNKQSIIILWLFLWTGKEQSTYTKAV